jgi:eukaryotic-like serine/threonine-protein kinase
MQDGPSSEVARTGLIVAGKFRLDGIIGQGGMGSVWSATHLDLGHRIAIKLVSREFVRSPEALRRFDAEAKAAAKLQSRHVVQIYDTGLLEDATPYIAMELLSGENLQQRIERTGPISLAEAVTILSQCCKALGRAHALRIVHRDIKPDNIFLSRSADDDEYVVKILDFGVAKLSVGETGDPSSTKTGTVLGTPLYMSPEQARGLKSIDHRTDLYSLGLVAYTMLTGRIAFSGESFGDILLKICTEPLPPIGLAVAGPPGVAPAMEAWFQRACARDPAARYPNAQEFSDALRTASGIGAVSHSGEQARPRAVEERREAPALGIQSGSPIASAAVAAVAAPSSSSMRSGDRAFPGQSVANASVALSASGIPKSRMGPAVAIGSLAVISVIAAVGLVALSSHRGQSVEPSAASQSLSQPSSPSPPASLVERPASVAPSSAIPTMAALAPESTAKASPPPSASGPTPAAPRSSVTATTAPKQGAAGNATAVGNGNAIAPAQNHAPHVAPAHGAPPTSAREGKEAAPPAPAGKIDLGY